MSDDGRRTTDDRRRRRSVGRRWSGVRRPSREAQLISRLLAERGIERHALFLTQREGLDLPDGVEAVSGFVLDARGRVHGFWLAWDDERGEYALAPFYPVEEPERDFGRDEEYHTARRALGLG